jgi:death on curing protein
MEDDRVVIYLTVERLLRLYANLIQGSVQQAMDQLRNAAALHGAVERPKQYAHYEDADLPMQAAVLAHGIAETQPFVDSNKRMALAAMLQFLELNGIWIAVSPDQQAAWIIGLAHGHDADWLAKQIRENSTSFWEIYGE